MTRSRPPLRIAAIQLGSSADLDENLRAVERLCEAATAEGARLLVLPENFAFFGSEGEKIAIAEALDASGRIHDTLSGIARRHGAYVIGGGMPEQSEQAARPFNTSVVYASDGSLVASYRKVHLFDVTLQDGTILAESAATTPGDRAVVVDVDGARVGLAICYDLRFPRLFDELVTLGAEVIVVTAAFTEQTGKDHWHVLLRARAIECQAYVVAAAQWGQHAGRPRSYGHSLVCDPWGTIVAECGEGVGFCAARLDFDYLEIVRARMPCVAHRRNRRVSNDAKGFARG